MSTAQLSFPDAFMGLFEPSRYKVYYGGRDGAKSYNFAQALLLKGLEQETHILCTREVQKSIKHSVHKLLSGIIKKNSFFNEHYTVLNNEIRGENGSIFAFEGLRLNEEGIKSYDGFDIVWVEEAAKVSDKSWETLIPTIRKDSSEIWISFNPRYVSDPTYQRFVVNKPESCIRRKVSYEDNPFTTDVMRKARADLKLKDPEAFDHVYDGNLDNRKTGAVYAKQIEVARKDGRICKVPYDPSCEVFTAWDLGFGDATSIWWLQFVGRELRWLEYFEDSGRQLDYYAKIVKEKDYNYSTHFLPHDAGHGNIRGLSVAKQLSSLGLRNKVLDRENDITAGIELLRQTIAYSVFDEKNCRDGIHSLDNYSYDWNEDRQIFSKKPLHDWTSHAADSARYAALATEFVKNKVRIKPVSYNRKTSGGYMG